MHYITELAQRADFLRATMSARRAHLPATAHGDDVLMEQLQFATSTGRPECLRSLRAVLVIVGCSFAALPAHAYLDPGTGSIILQSLLAGIAVAIGVLRLYWQRFKSFLGSLTGSADEPAAKANGEQTQDREVNDRPR